MLIRVQYLNGNYDYVKPHRLDVLIDGWKISQFKRSTGWVNVSRDPVRRGGEESYSGPERRGAESLH